MYHEFKVDGKYARQAIEQYCNRPIIGNIFYLPIGHPDLVRVQNLWMAGAMMDYVRGKY